MTETTHPIGKGGFLQDLSLSAVVAGFLIVLVGFTSSAAIVIQAAEALQASPKVVGSWILALGLGMGVTCIGLSMRYRVPISTAWSTSGAAMLIAGAGGTSMDQAVGAFMLSAVLIIIAGFTGWFERVMERLPLTIASGMLAGLLLRFGIDVALSAHSEPVLVLGMFITYIFTRKAAPRFAIIASLICGIGIAMARGDMGDAGIALELTEPVFTMPGYSLGATLGIAVPLFIVTMASQNMPGIAVIRASGYNVPVSPLIGWTGVATMVFAAFGAFALNLAAITAAIGMGREAHENPSRRYVASVAAGGFYIVVGLFGATVVAAFAVLPKVLISCIAGIALLSTIGNSLAMSLEKIEDREAALITFLVTASGVTFFGVGSAFWGLVAGGAAYFVSRKNSSEERG